MTTEEEAKASTEEVVVAPETTEEEKPDENKDLSSALAQKEHWREKAEKAETARKALEDQLNKQTNEKPKTAVDVEEVLNITTALEGLDQREKEYVVKQHKLTGKAIVDIRKEEDFAFWQTAYRAKAEKEKSALKPNGTQSESEKPKSLAEKLAGASIADKEKILIEAGLYKVNKPRTDRQSIGERK